MPLHSIYTWEIHWFVHPEVYGLDHKWGDRAREMITVDMAVAESAVASPTVAQHDLSGRGGETWSWEWGVPGYLHSTRRTRCPLWIETMVIGGIEGKMKKADKEESRKTFLAFSLRRQEECPWASKNLKNTEHLENS